ncbi:MAG: rod-binding protein [Nitrospinota bacterium]
MNIEGFKSSDSLRLPLVDKANKGDLSKLREAAVEFQSIFYSKVLKSMRDTIDETEGLFKKNDGERLFTSMLDDQFATLLSNESSSGQLADKLVEQLSQLSRGRERE